MKSVVEISDYEMCSRRLFPPHHHALAAAADAAAAAGGTCGGRGSLSLQRCSCPSTCNTTTFRFKMDGGAAFHPSVTQHVTVKNESSALGKAKPGKVSRVSVATFLDLGFGLKVVADLLGMGRKLRCDDSAWLRCLRSDRAIPLWDEDFSTGFRLRLEPLGRF